MKGTKEAPVLGIKLDLSDYNRVAQLQVKLYANRETELLFEFPMKTDLFLEKLERLKGQIKANLWDCGD